MSQLRQIRNLALIGFMGTGKSTVGSMVARHLRFQYVDELNRMGAHITIEGVTAFIKGPSSFIGTSVNTTDLRAGAALVIAGLVADGETEVDRVNLIDRGYESFVNKLRNLGANIRRI